ncbi:MAG: class I SAM-dependent methyltransferase [Halanaerobiales bacterium]|nr:class I SAM-dependent methyltransferase [Halanaerobiales bacterium]
MTKRNLKIVDLGSGQNPHPEAGIIVDKHLDNVSRGKNIKLPDDAEFVNADIANLPFKDKQFDFSYCTHVLEHINDPIKCCKEIIRVSKAGYIETPRHLWEVLFGRKYHLWFVDKIENKLMFTKKTKENYLLNTFQGDKIYAECELFRTNFHENKDLFYMRFHWTDSFEVQVIR